MSIFSEYTKAPQNDAQSKERRYHAKNGPGLKSVDCELNVEGDVIWISAYWLMSSKGLSTRMEDSSQRGRPTKIRLLARQMMSVMVSDALTLVQSILMSA
jgi:hypothetical protein